MSGHQSLQEFFDSPPAMAADYNLSASYSEPVTPEELIDIAPEAEGILRTLPSTIPAGMARGSAGRGRGPIWRPERRAGLPDERARWIAWAPLPRDDRAGRPGGGADAVLPAASHRPRMARGGSRALGGAAQHAWVPDLDALDDLLRTPTRLVIATFLRIDRVHARRRLRHASDRDHRSPGNAADLG